jgi:hypothetical protein
VHELAADVELRLELRRVSQRDLDEEHVVIRRDVMVLLDLLQLLPVLGHVPAVRFVGDEPQLLAGAVVEEAGRHVVEAHRRDAQLESAQEPREDRDEQDRGDEAGPDLDPVRALDDVGQRRVDEDRRDGPEGDRPAALTGAPGGDGDRHRGGGDQDQHTGGVGAALRVHVRIEEPRT